ncbi:thiol reductant ABC exporter subunit CydD [Pseudoclavibacter sp. CFCC 13796]|nr:thiol reductant ABC exporter subunit CydD [Pseudoclavibacter sp. CFCC 13796]
MKPIDPRLLRRATAARGYLLVSGLIGLLQIACILVFSWAVAQCVAGALMQHLTWNESLHLVALAAAAQAIRALLAYAWNVSSEFAAAKVKAQLREQMAERFAALGPAWLASRSAPQLTTVYGRGLDALDGYFSKFLPQLVLTVISVPVFLFVLWREDLPSAITVGVTLPLIPIFMILIGWYTQRVQNSEWEASRTLSGHFVDVVTGLSTLKVFGRQWHQRDVISTVTDHYRQRTMRVLGISFMSGFVLELASTLAVALVAVSIGTRLIGGEIDLYTGLFVLLIAPEAFSPLRLVGSHYHAATEGISAADDALSVLDEPDSRPGAHPAAPIRSASHDAITASAESPSSRRPADLRLEDICVSRGDVELQPVTLRAEAGRLTVVSGPSGAGKSSIFAALLGFAPATGQVIWQGERIDLERDAPLRPFIAWSGQRTDLFPGTIASNVALGLNSGDHVDADLLRRCLRLAGAGRLDLDQVIDPVGGGISGGQAQRVCIARAYYRAFSHDCRIVLLDEPTSAVDEQTEREMIAGMRTMAQDGRVVVVISHRPRVIAAADARVSIAAQPTGRAGGAVASASSASRDERDGVVA